MSDKREKRFRLRGPSMMIENVDVPNALRDKAWAEAIGWISQIKWERVHSFKLQVNFLREAERQAKGEQPNPALEGGRDAFRRRGQD